MGMKYRDPSTGQFKDLKVKTSDTLPIGTQVAYGGIVPPTGWLICDGSAVSRTTYAELFKVIGTSYGACEGSTTFNLPNKKGRVSAGYDSTNSKFNAIGKHIGEETHMLTIAEMPEHTHSINTSSTSGGQVDNMPWGSTAATQIANTKAAGGDSPHNNIQPTEVDNWIIKAFQSIGVVGKVANTKTNSDKDTYSCNYINGISKDVYSTSEVKTNKVWIDGKPIYRKIVLGITATGTYNPQISNFDELVDVYGSVKIVNANWEPLPRGAIADADTYSMAIGSVSGTTLYAEIGTFYTSKIEKSRVIIEYTKTTD